MSGFPILETERLILRPAHARLTPQVTAFYRKNAAWLQQFEPTHEPGFTREAYQRRLLREDAARAHKGESLRYWFAAKDDPKTTIGCVVLDHISFGALQSCVIAYKLDRDAQHQGYATEAVSYMTDIAFSVLKLHRVEALIMPRNGPSLALARRCGFSEEGLAKQYLRINGVWEDHIRMVRLAPENREEDNAEL